MKKKTLAEQKVMLADLIEKGRSMMSREELMDFVPHLTLQLWADWHSKNKLFIYHFGFALVAKLGSVKLAKKYLVRLFQKKISCLTRRSGSANVLLRFYTKNALHIIGLGKILLPGFALMLSRQRIVVCVSSNRMNLVFIAKSLSQRSRSWASVNNTTPTRGVFVCVLRIEMLFFLWFIKEVEMAHSNASNWRLGVVKQIASEAGQSIKRIVLEEISFVREKFPKITFGVRDNKPREYDVVDGMLGSVDVTVRAVEREIPGIVLWKKDEFWTKASAVVLTEEGIFECGYVMSEPLDSAQQRKKGYCVRIETRLDWTYKKERPDLWVKYGEQAMLELMKLRDK